MTKGILGTILGLLCLTTHARAATADNVILLMLDGVRWQEVFNGDQQGVIFKNLWQELAADGAVFGNREKGAAMTVSNQHYISLPAYQSIMAGVTTGCGSNNCGRTTVETVEERIKKELGLDRMQVASISSWDQIPNAVEKTEGSIFTNAAFKPLHDGSDDPVFESINAAQAKDKPEWPGARYDRYTWAHSMHYLDKHRPRFMFISLNDSDEWGHKGEWKNYVETLRQYDAYIRELVMKLKSMGEYGSRTMLLVTTDHGRGEGGNWKNHGWLWPSSKYIWLYGRPANATGGEQLLSTTEYHHVDIRPTIEAALGLRPVACENCGQVMRELVPGNWPVPATGRRGSLARQ